MDQLLKLLEQNAKLTTDQLSALLGKSEEEIAKAIPPVMIWGAPGVGKSTAIRELAKKLGIGIVIKYLVDIVNVVHTVKNVLVVDSTGIGGFHKITYAGFLITLYHFLSFPMY